MKRNEKIIVAVGVGLLIAIAFALFVPTAHGACPANEDYCQGWSKADQEQKNRIAFLNQVIASHADVLKGCDDVTPIPEFSGKTCIGNYDNSGLNVLSALAKKNALPYDKVVLAMIAENYDWGWQATNALKRPIVGADWSKHFIWGINGLADDLRVNHPLIMLNGDEMQWCVAQEYGGVCPGLW